MIVASLCVLGLGANAQAKTRAVAAKNQGWTWSQPDE